MTALASRFKTGEWREITAELTESRLPLFDRRRTDKLLLMVDALARIAKARSSWSADGLVFSGKGEEAFKLLVAATKDPDDDVALSAAARVDEIRRDNSAAEIVFDLVPTEWIVTADQMRFMS